MREDGETVPEPARQPMPGARASDEDRRAVVVRLQDAAGDGLLDLDELEDRLGATWRARTLPELASITADLPARTEPTAPARPAPVRGLTARIGPPAFRSMGFRMHATVYGLTNGFLVGIWGLTGADFFWPFFPAAGWGIGLGTHFVAANAAERRRERDGHRPRRAVPPPMPSIPARPAMPVPPTPPGLHSVPAAAAGPGRRFVVAAFVDVVGSTELNEAMGDERWAQVRARLHEVVDQVVRRYAGREANRAGDGVLLRFDDPAAAVHAMVELMDRLARQRAETGYAPEVRIGIHSGDAVDEGQDIIGVVVNLAARVSAAADPDEILVTEHVADHADRDVQIVSRGLHELKGIARPRNLHSVDWRRP